MPMYVTKFKFKNKWFEVGIQPVGSDGYDLDIRTNKRMSGDEFQALKKYLQEEGYIDAARDWHAPNIAKQ